MEVDDEEEDGEEIENYECQHRFVPLAFEGYGAWGESALRFFAEVCAQTIRQSRAVRTR